MGRRGHYHGGDVRRGRGHVCGLTSCGLTSCGLTSCGLTRVARNRLQKDSILHLILGGAAVHGCASTGKTVLYGTAEPFFRAYAVISGKAPILAFWKEAIEYDR